MCPRKLDESKGISRGLGKHTASLYWMQIRRLCVQKFQRGISAEPVKFEHGKARFLERRRVPGSECCDECDAFCFEAPREKADHAQTGPVQPVDIVGDQDERALVGRFAHKLVRREGDQKRVGLESAGDAERRLQGSASVGRAEVPSFQNRAQELMQPGEGELSLRFNAGSRQRAHPQLPRARPHDPGAQTSLSPAPRRSVARHRHEGADRSTHPVARILHPAQLRSNGAARRRRPVTGRAYAHTWLQ